MPNAEFWRGRRVLITGHTGFKGSWLSLLLKELGSDITGIALPPPTKPSLFEFAEVDKELRSIEGDIRRVSALWELTRSCRPEVVFHLAAQSVVATGYSDPITTFHTNALGTANVLEAVRGVGSVKAVVSVTTDKVYADPDSGRRFVETDPLGGHDPYAASKAAAEIITQSYRDSFLARHGVGVGTARGGNVLGGGDWTPHQLIPEVISAFAAGHPATLRHPDAVRPWQHVLDALSGYIDLAEKLVTDPEEFSGAWNFGPAVTQDLSVAHVTNRLAALWGSQSSWRADSQAFPEEAATLSIDSTKARDRLGWEPRLILDAALAWVVDWYRSYYEGNDLTRQQVTSFLEL
jgi:CDP-glucose 4,6-dehydratase